MFFWIKKILLHFLGSMLAIFLVDYFVDDFTITATEPIEIAKVVALMVVFLTIGNVIVKPILKVVSLPFMMVSFGLFTLLINAAILFAVETLLDGVVIKGWETYLYLPLVLSISSWILHHLLYAKKKHR